MVEMRNITKRFPGVVANRNVTLRVRPGEIHALLGENGAGKSTLMSVLAGLYRPDEGQIFLRGRPVDIRSPKDAIELGIGMVYQHFMLVKPMTVAENVILGLDSGRFVLDLASVERELKALTQHYRLAVDPKAAIWQLSVGEQQRVEILKLLYRGADILILDEPTAVLTPQESEELGRTLRHMAAEGKAVIFITHKLDEVMTFADRVTVLRAGEVTATVNTADTSKQELARLMVGREVLFHLEKEPTTPGEIVLDVENLHASNAKGLPALRGVSFTIRAGEILGIAGVAGNGQHELAEVVTGLRPATGGTVQAFGRPITNRSPYEAIQAGVSHIPGDRMGVGLAANMTVSDNLIMKGYRSAPLANGPFFNFAAIGDFARRLIAGFNIATPAPTTPVRMLSGGNLQKTILAREITASRGLLIAVHPTRGLDVGATEAVRRTLLAERGAGAAILLISEDLDELLAISDRIAVIYEGEIMGVVPAEGADIEALGLMMAGAGRQAAELHAGS
ncbi:MAG TPA: heme ABC transporter ATP-binding protein [Chloroflexi bacterium]|nr:heme ABC transporter ATP-binding protein [Chloroflexota bacterium]